MKFDTLTVASLLLFSSPSFAHPQPVSDIRLATREDASVFETRDSGYLAGSEELWKRKGGGGGGGKGGGGSSGGSSGSSGDGDGGSTGSSGGSTGSTGGSTGSTGSTGSSGSSGGKPGSSSGSSGSTAPKGSSSSFAGGATKQGSGVQPTYGGGRLYGGGSTTPYSSGIRSPLGIAPIFIGAAILPGIWLYGAYSYPYHEPYTFYNRTANANSTNSTNTNHRRGLGLELWQRAVQEGANQTKPVTCLCAAYQECGCDDSGNTTFLNSLIGDGTYSALNQSLVNVADVNGTSTILLNGTLPNGTTIPGGTESANRAGAGMRGLMEASGYWVMIALVGCTVFLV